MVAKKATEKFAQTQLIIMFLVICMVWGALNFPFMTWMGLMGVGGLMVTLGLPYV